MTEATGASTRKPWIAIVAAFFLTEIVMVACAYLWVLIYSIFVAPGGDDAFYQAYAQRASPVVAVVVAFPVFYLMARFMGRYGDLARFAAFAVVAINLIVDASVVVTMAQDLSYNVMMSIISAGMKVAGAYLGSRGPEQMSENQ